MSEEKLRAEIQDLRDQVEFWRRHYGHTMEGKPAGVMAIALAAFDPRKHCRQCRSDWKSLEGDRGE